MIISNTITKKLLENLIQETFSRFGTVSSSSLLDSLKLLGFSYATFAGISINIEDLKTPNSKKNFIDQANIEITEVSDQWQQGTLSDTERFQTIIDSWNIATESLKNRIVEYYQNYDPTNNLYIMAFSGARGNMSQVRQLVGMRGLMADQDGKIIDLPIQSNFREGLSSIDYIISSYGARKGIVDTALKTADSGYLTRRLIYIAQDLVIRQKDCGTTEGIIFLLEKNSNIKNLIGRSLISRKSPFSKTKNKDFLNIILTLNHLAVLKKESPLILNIKSSLTCKANGSICQNCYGWDLAQNKLVSLGEAVGIVAAQSIGEPGTQLTMRTFHTGGIFTGELLNQIRAPFSGKIVFPKVFKTLPYRTSHGILVLKLQQEISILLINWQGKTKEIFLDIGSFLYENSFGFIKKGDLIAECMNQSILPGGRKLKPIFSSITGEIRFENLLVRKMFREKRVIKVNQDDGVLWLASGKLFILPKEAEFFSKKSLLKARPFSSLQLISPYQGIVSFSNNEILITGTEKTFSLNLNQLKIEIKNVFTKFSFLLKNYQYIDSFTALGIFHFFSNYEGTIYSIRKKDSKYKTTFFLVTEDDIWKINSDNVNDFSFFPEKRGVIRVGALINSTLKTKNSGIFLKKDGFKMIFQTAFPVFLSRGTILTNKQGDFVLEKKVIANLVNYTQQTEDIVQGLPKIEELIEARKPKVKSYLASRPGILMNSTFLKDEKDEKIHEVKRFLKENIIKCVYGYFNLMPSEPSSKKKKKEKQAIYLSHSIFSKEPIILIENKIYKGSIIPSFFEETAKKDVESIFKASALKNAETLLIDGKKTFSSWDLFSNNQNQNLLSIYKNNEVFEFKKLTKDHFVYENKKHDLLISLRDKSSLKQKASFYLEYLNPLLEYNLPLTSKIIFEPGNFIDIGEPFTEGIIDIHELLHIFFKYHSTLDGTMLGYLKSLHKFQLLMVNSIQAIYQSQGVNISSKHIEIIVRQMTSKVVIKESGDTPFLPGELVRFSLISQIYKSLKMSKNSNELKTPKFEPALLSSTNISLTKDGFLSSAGFQETKKVLTRAALEGSSDWLRGLKECIIVGRIIPAGSTFLNYKNYLDNVYLFKN
jgi:hypothetical protein